MTRPDLLVARSILSEFLQRPTLTHLAAAERVLRYIWTTRDQGLVFYHRGRPELIVYSDANFATGDAKQSRIGFLTLFASGCITAESRKLKHCFPESVAESEFIAEWYGLKQTRFVRIFLSELGFPITVIHLLGDNLSNEKILNNDYTRSKLRGLAIIFQSLIHHVAHGDATTCHIDGKLNPADLLSKPVTRHTLEDATQLRSLFMFIPSVYDRCRSRVDSAFTSCHGTGGDLS